MDIYGYENLSLTPSEGHGIALSREGYGNFMATEGVGVFCREGDGAASRDDCDG